MTHVLRLTVVTSHHHCALRDKAYVCTPTDSSY
eukprot:CAMPEP_0181208198 /NCGR_PEP_ID=MMETSP1096-20121128/21993_1 /TAXON_ID=156174 ORGANISM="Chrysochromulina ericina, Strain CCMP281" /NCGR_SAMPLE_ID=MMETSP1096 /ASSEMBLY_ACC=CAM_ASM_000453 /LENGTH=32 /DNA_ID= /DNA_START= /DNA_END= /DNA_ORIENTATION=